MSLKISQCLLPLVHKQNLLQLFNSPSSHDSRKLHCFKKNDKQIWDKFTLNVKRFCTEKCDRKAGENFAVVLHAVKDLRVEKRPIPKINPNQVLIEVEVCGICDIDVNFFQDGKLGPWALDKPLIMGHEASGTIVECGDCVKNLKVGDKIAIEPQVSCRVCPLCKAGKYHMCPNIHFCAVPPYDGNLCRYFAHDSDFCHKIPDHLDYELAVLIEPLSVAVHACKKGHITSGDSVLILGSGPVGLASMLAARACGASSVIVLDINTYKLKKAMEMGADCAINCKGVPEQEIVKKVHEILGHAPNKTIDCCGFEAAIRIGILATANCGAMVIAGFGKNNQCLPIMNSVYKEIDIMGAMRYANDYGTAIDMVANGKVDMKSVVTHHFKMENACKAFEFASKKEEEYLKILIHANPNWNPSSNC